ncbi:MAG: carboxypeptidase regulatory-like domain-containing protein, partial [Paludibacteraceae bacterium]|nr:carboxypeptidase regulatory-like domain-containing protein [Paludibacteraceae bacterium]
MKKHPFLTVMAAVVLALLWLTPQPVQANDYLEKQYNYSIYTTGPEKIHFKIPVWAYGTINDYLALPYSHVSYKFPGKGEVEILRWVAHARSDNNEDNNRGTVNVKFPANMGDIVVTSMANGVHRALQGNGEWSGWLTVVQHADGDYDRVTFLEFDWYPPETMDTTEFSIKLYSTVASKFSVITRAYIDEDVPDDYYSVPEADQIANNWTFDGPFRVQNNSVAPQLYTPYLYQLNENGLTGYGYAAIPYSVFDEPISYTTSYNPTAVKLGGDDRAGSIYIMTDDTIHNDVYADFVVWRDKEEGMTKTLRSTSVKVAPYHRIYNFMAYEDLDSTGTFTGNNVLRWSIKNPTLTDIVEGDYFVVERATDSLYSDARQLTMVAMGRDSTGVYQFVDASRDTWTGNMPHPDTLQVDLSRKLDNYVIYDEYGDPAYLIDFRISTNKMPLPSIPVYYRIARASATIWGWDSEFVSDYTMLKNNFLAPLADNQEDYTLDEKYDENHKVHFRIRLENSEVTSPQLVPEEDFDAIYMVKEDVRDEIKLHTPAMRRGNETLAYITVYPSKEFAPLVPGVEWDLKYERDYNLGRGNYVEIRYLVANDISETYAFEISTDMELEYDLTADGYVNSVRAVKKDRSSEYVTPEKIQHLKDSIYQVFQEEYAQTDYGRCMWDKTASLVLVRTMEETDYSTEFIIPQDSIVRQADGSWLATFSDVADQACTHYSYAVRIDQTRSDLRVEFPSQLEPKTLNGPDLYFDQGADIRSFLASRGVTTTETKPGVMLHWVPSNQSVDEFVLQRKVKDSDLADTTIYRGLETTFFDDTALPSVIYEYTVTANFNCNGRATSNSDTTIGWRTQYAEISGTIVLTDNSGMPAVNVALQDSAGNVIRTQMTGPDGTYRFDSLTYDLTNGSTYVVIPTNTYAQFSFNNTSASTAAITLSADNAVASHIDFVNLSCARLTGRALYKNSTVPVADAMFLLNGDTILRSGAPLQTGVDGNFAIIVPMSQPNTLQIIKPGHTFEGDGILQVEEGKDTFALTEPLDGVRFYDLTKVRLVGRVAGGNNQRDLPEAFGVGKNNLGDNLQLILQMEGDNTAHFVHDPNDLSRDTFDTRFPHVVYSTDPQSTEPERIVGETHMVTEKKRILIAPDPLTGEYEVDLFPVKYKVTQATATGYATLFAAGQGNEVIDLTNAPLISYTAIYDAAAGKVVVEEETAMQIIHRDNTISNTYERELTELEVPVESLINDGDSVHYNGVYDRIYHNPVQISLVQNIYGLERVGYGEPEMEVNGMHPDQKESVALYTNYGNQVVYTLGYPVFYGGRKYQFKATAYEDYYYNNTEDGRLDRVPQRGGNVMVRNGLHNATTQAVYQLDKNGENSGIWLDVDNVDVENAGSIPTRSVSVALETEGNVVETNVFTAYVTGTVVEESSLRPSDGGIQLLDIIRDPGGAGSYAYIDNGTTYGFGFTQSISAQFGVELQPTWGSNTTQYIGIYSGATAGGSWIGSEVQTQKAFSFSLPISCRIDYTTDYSYTVTTSEQITTSSDNTPYGVGSNADVFVGTTLANITGRAKTISIINDSLFQACQPSLNAGAMLLLAQGTGADGRTYYLVTGQKVVIGAAVNNSFAYSQAYILETLIPRLATERQNLMMTFTDSAQAQTMANELGRPVYWLIETDSTALDTIPLNTHRMFVPNTGLVYVDEVDQLNNEIAQWVDLIYANEREKVLARTKGTRLGTYSASSGTSYSYADTYECAYNYSEYPQTLLSTFKRAGTKMIGSLLSGLAKRGLLKLFNKPVATSAASALNEYYTSEIASTVGEDGTISVDKNKTLKTVDEVAAQAGNMKFHMKFAPIKDFSADKRMSTSATITKSVGFTLVPDASGDISVSVYKAEIDSAWNADTEEVLDEVEQSDNDVIKYGSYVFFTEGGATMCPHEEAETTDFYNPGTPLGNGTEWVAKPELAADTYEKTNIAPDKRATFRVQLFNQGQVDAGVAENGMGFYLCLDGASNPDGAKVYVNGAPLIQSVYYWLVPGSPLTQTIEVERGTVDDYNLRLSLYSADCPLTSSEMDLGVHFMPLSTDVAISMPRQNWVMNTLSPHDSAGYYLPVTIDGFDIHHKNFDHIEFQYKLATQSDDDWVNLCSFYAEDSLYDLASGSKAMIENGRITPFHFYGERDPMEQKYDLRAVSFCRYGSGYVTKTSTVVSGTKDTRTPVVFGEPEPANSILGVGDHLKLRF